MRAPSPAFCRSHDGGELLVGPEDETERGVVVIAVGRSRVATVLRGIVDVSVQHSGLPKQILENVDGWGDTRVPAEECTEVHGLILLRGVEPVIGLAIGGFGFAGQDAALDFGQVRDLRVSAEDLGVRPPGLGGGPASGLGQALWMCMSCFLALALAGVEQTARVFASVLDAMRTSHGSEPPEFRERGAERR